jgi:hypothetical protein
MASLKILGEKGAGCRTTTALRCGDIAHAENPMPELFLRLLLPTADLAVLSGILGSQAPRLTARALQNQLRAVCLVPAAAEFTGAI